MKISYLGCILLLFLIACSHEGQDASTTERAITPAPSVVTQPTLNDLFDPTVVGLNLPLAVDPITGYFVFSKKTYWGAVELSTFETMNLTSLQKDRDLRSILVLNLDEVNSFKNLISNTYGKGCLQVYKKITAADEWRLVESAVFLRNDGSAYSCVDGFGETLVSGDIDNDGRMDFLAPYYQQTYLFKNLGNGIFKDAAPNFLSLIDYSPRVEGAAMLDLFGTGSIDILVGPVIARNNGSGAFSKLSVPPSYLMADEGILVRDLDNDGHFEIVKLGTPNPTVKIFKVRGENDITLWREIDFGTGSVDVFGITAADFFGKGCEDLIFPGGRPAGSGVIMLENDCRGGFSVKQFSGMPGVFQSVILADDFNGDWRPDFSGYISPATISPVRPTQGNAGDNFLLRNVSAMYFYFNRSGRRNNFSIQLLKNGSVYKAAGLGFILRDRLGKRRAFHQSFGEGFLTQKSARTLLSLQKSECPHIIESLDGAFLGEISCDGGFTGGVSVRGLTAKVAGDYEIASVRENLLSEFNTGAWVSLDGGLLEPQGSSWRLTNRTSNWGAVRALYQGPDKCRGSYLLTLVSNPGTTLPVLKIGQPGDWTVISALRSGGRYEQRFSLTGSFVISLSNESPSINEYSEISLVSLECS